MSQIRVNDITDSGGGNSSTPSQIRSGRAKAWVNFNGTGTVAIRSDYNVNTVSDNGTGLYTVNFSTAMPNASYAAVAAAGHASYHDVRTSYKNASFATGSFRFAIANNANNVDGQYANVAIFTT